MLCDICSKNNATVHLTEIIDGSVTKLNLCESCAREKGAEMESHFGLSDLLAGLADFGVQVQDKGASILKCGNCGLKYNDFKKIGRLGCSECYDVFKKALAPLLKRIHGSDQHLGKAPESVTEIIGEDITMQELKDKLQKAVQFEEFEEAAKIRDEIKKLEKEKEKK